MGKELKLYDFESRECWLAGRNTGVGASEVAVLFGLAPESWGSAWSMWAEKTGRNERPPLKGEWLDWGHKLEPVIAAEYTERTGRKLWDGGGPYVVAIDQELEILRCTPDRWVIDAPGKPGNGLLQMKNAGWYMAHDWDEGVPDHIVMQVQSEMACTGLGWASVAVLVGGNSFKHFDVERDEETIAEIRAHVSWFWNLVKTDTPPPIDGSEATAKAIKRLHPHDSGDEVTLTFEHAIAWDRLREMKVEIAAIAKSHKAALGEAENTLKAAIGSATFGRLPDGRRLSLKTIERAGYPVPPTTYRTLKLEKEGKR